MCVCVTLCVCVCVQRTVLGAIRRSWERRRWWRGRGRERRGEGHERRRQRKRMWRENPKSAVLATGLDCYTDMLWTCLSLYFALNLYIKLLCVCVCVRVYVVCVCVCVCVSVCVMD